MPAACHRYTVLHSEITMASTLACPHRSDVDTGGIWIISLDGVPTLTLNARQHWAAEYRTKEQIRNAVWWRARAAKIPHLDYARVELHLVPPDRRRRDVDNLVATLKPAVDALRAEGVLTDDDPAHADLAMPVIEPPRADRQRMLYLVVIDLGDTR